MKDLQAILFKGRERLLDLHHTSHSGHIGGNLSCIDALLTLHHRVMSPEDRFVLSKGHSAGALYVTLWTLGKLGDADLDSFCRDGTALPGHPSGNGVPGLMFATGSLGHGPSLASGLALAARHQGSGRRVFCLCSDGEWQEGSCWEALIFAVHQRLDNLTLLVDRNGLQGFGTTEEVASMGDMAARFAAFGASTAEADGHSPEAMLTALSRREAGKPLVVLLKTLKGRGLHFEGALESHYLPLSQEQYEAGRERLRAERNS